MPASEAVDRWNSEKADLVRRIAIHLSATPSGARDFVLTDQSTAANVVIMYKIRQSTETVQIRSSEFASSQEHLTSVLEELASKASARRIPPLVFPDPGLALPLAGALVVLGVIAVYPETSYHNWKAGILLDAAARASLIIFRSQVVTQYVFYAAVFAHVGEGLCVFRTLHQMNPNGALEWTRVFGWTIQTTLLGFPSLHLLTSLIPPVPGSDEGSERKTQ